MTYTLRALRLPVTRADVHGFVESDGYVAIEAADTSAAHLRWRDALGGIAGLWRNEVSDDRVSGDC